MASHESTLSSFSLSETNFSFRLKNETEGHHILLQKGYKLVNDMCNARHWSNLQSKIHNIIASPEHEGEKKKN